MNVRQTLQEALAHHQGGRLDQAEALYRRVLAADGRNADALHLLGVIAYQRKHYDAAIDLIGRALAINRRSPAYHSNLGVALLDRGRLAEAEAAFRRSLRLRPNDAGTMSNLGLTLLDLDRPAEAIAALKRAVAIDPDYAEGWSNLGLALQKVGRLGEAEEAYRRCLERKPDFADAYLQPGNALKDQGRLDEALDRYERARALAPESALTLANLVMCGHYHPEWTGERLYRLACEYGALQRRLVGPAKSDHANPPDPDRPLRVGYVSADFRSHSVARFFEPLLAHHDPTAVIAGCYADVDHPDAVTERLQRLAQRWVACAGRTDAELAARIVEDGIDILVDLAGHTRGNRLGVFARRPAPVQVTWLGYPGTTGLDCMDYRLTDAIADPPGAADREHTEALVRLPRSFLCFHAPEEAPPVAPLPAAERGVVTFASFNHLAKMTDQVVALWSRLLAAVPGSRLLLKAMYLGDAGVAEATRARFAAHGVPPDRIETCGWLAERGGHLALYGEVDIALDTFPYNGTTTTCEALWMGVPVVTMVGARHASRVGASLLGAVGLDDLIAEDADGYLARAVTLAGEGERLAGLRASLRERVATSPLCDGRAFARAVETAYREMWRRWCASRTAGERH